MLLELREGRFSELTRRADVSLLPDANASHLTKINTGHTFFKASWGLGTGGSRLGLSCTKALPAKTMHMHMHIHIHVHIYI